MDYYDSIANGYEELHKEEQIKKIKLILPHINFKQNSPLHILDVGCGTGIFFEFISDKNAQKIGIDPSKELIKIAKSKKNVGDCTYFVESAEKMHFDDHKFDLVVSLTAIQNFSDITQGLLEIKRVGKAQAQCVLTFLKKSEKRKLIEQAIESIFEITKKVEEEKDIIYFCTMLHN